MWHMIHSQVVQTVRIVRDIRTLCALFFFLWTIRTIQYVWIFCLNFKKKTFDQFRYGFFNKLFQAVETSNVSLLKYLYFLSLSLFLSSNACRHRFALVSRDDVKREKNAEWMMGIRFSGGYVTGFSRWCLCTMSKYRGSQLSRKASICFQCLPAILGTPWNKKQKKRKRRWAFSHVVIAIWYVRAKSNESVSGLLIVEWR